MEALRRDGWNRNIHYHDLILKAIPPGCQRTLDVGCGRGALSRQLGRYCEEVIGIDRDHDALAKPGGLLAVIGLHHTTLVETCAQAIIVLPVSWAHRCVQGHAQVGAPISEPVESIGEIRRIAAGALPGVHSTRLLLFRYSLFWRKPSSLVP